jgi:hypothetical protein
MTLFKGSVITIHICDIIFYNINKYHNEADIPKLLIK